MKRSALLLLALLPWTSAAPAQQAPAAGHTMADASRLDWGDPPPGFEPAARFALLAGDPSKAGGLFVVRLKMPAGYQVKRHWHPTDEHVTVLQGALAADMGTGAAAHQARFDTGDYVLMPARMPHAVTAQGETIVQVVGVGPFEIHYVDPKDDPRSRATAD